MKQHFEYVPFSLSIAVNCVIGMLTLPVAAVAGKCFSHHAETKCRICGFLILAALAALVYGANKLLYVLMKRHTEADITVSGKRARLSAVLSAAASALPTAALLKFGAVDENTVIALCMNISIFVFALTIYYSKRPETMKRNR